MNDKTQRWCAVFIAAVAMAASGIAEADDGTKNATQTKQVLGVCKTIQGLAEIYPTSDAAAYMYRFRHIDRFDAGAPSDKIIQQPKNGVLQLSPYTNPGNPYKVYQYVPNETSSNDWRDDSFVITIENNGVSVEVRYHIHIESVDEVRYELCDKQMWKISSTPCQFPIGGNLAPVQCKNT